MHYLWLSGVEDQRIRCSFTLIKVFNILRTGSVFTLLKIYPSLPQYLE
jgi:hypothetical protein